MTYALRIRPSAEADVDGAAEFIAQHNLDAALRLYDAVDETYRLILEHPDRWPRYELEHAQLATLRKCALVGFQNYLVFYLVEAASVEITRVLHGARDIPAVLADELSEE